MTDNRIEMADWAFLQDIVVKALFTDGAHHKQWFLVQIAKRFDLDLPDDYEPGIAP